jgi:SPP1 gp7 family putative phage head morphogenesis protein
MVSKQDPSRPVRTLFTREFLALIRNARGQALEVLRPKLKDRHIDVHEILRIISALNGAYIDIPGESLINRYIRQAFLTGIEDTHAELIMQQKPAKKLFEEPLKVSINFNQYDQRAVDNLTGVSLSDLKGFTSEMSKKIVRDIVEADKKGGGITEFTKIIQEHYTGIGAPRAEMIARTTTTQAYNEASWSRAKEYAPYKEWISTLHSERTRASHLAMSGVIIPVDDAFQVPAFMASKNTRVDACEMMYPGDSSMGAPAGQIIQCRCAVGPRFLMKKK